MSLQTDRVDYYRQFAVEGYVVVRGLWASDDLALVASESERLLARRDLIDINNLRCRWQNQCHTGECRFDAYDPVIDLSPVIAGVAHSPRLLEVLHEIYGEPACLFKDKLIYKPPGATGYGLHQDYISWPSFPNSFVSVVVPLDETTTENGCTIVYPRRHREGCLSTADGDYHELPLSTVDEATAVPLELSPGDVAIFSGYLPHRSNANQSQGWRRQLYLSYNALSDGGEQRAAHYREFHDWLKKKYAEFGKHDTYFD